MKKWISYIILCIIIPALVTAGTFIFKDKDGKETTVKYYEYDTNFYAALVEDKVYLVNKMNVKDLDEAYQKMVNPDTEDAEESTSDTATEEN